MPCQTFTNIWKKKQAIFLPDEIFWSLLDDVKYVFQSTEYISRKEKHDIEGIVREISYFSCFVSSKPWHAKKNLHAKIN